MPKSLAKEGWWQYVIALIAIVVMFNLQSCNGMTKVKQSIQ